MAYGNKKNLLSALAISMVITFSGMAAAQEQPAASNDSSQKIMVVRITSLLGLKPETVLVNKGTTVVWVNQMAEGVEIVFTAKQVTRACLSPTCLGMIFCCWKTCNGSTRPLTTFCRRCAATSANTRSSS